MAGRLGPVPPTCDRVVTLQGQGVIFAGAGAHQVQPALAAGRGEVADVLEGRADGRPGVCVGVVALHLHHVQSGPCRAGRGSGPQGARGKGKFPEMQAWGLLGGGGEHPGRGRAWPREAADLPRFTEREPRLRGARALAPGHTVKRRGHLDPGTLDSRLHGGGPPRPLPFAPTCPGLRNCVGPLLWGLAAGPGQAGHLGGASGPLCHLQRPWDTLALGHSLCLFQYLSNCKGPWGESLSQLWRVGGTRRASVLRLGAWWNQR